MSDDRTPRQRAAHNALDAAIRECVAAMDDVEGQVVTVWMVTGAIVGAEPDETTHFELYPDGVQPSYVSLGLIEIARQHLLRGPDDS